MKKALLLFLVIGLFSSCFATCYKIQHVEPLNWWVGMAQKELQIAIHGKNISETEPVINYEGVSISRKVLTDNPNYIFLYVNIEPTTKPGTMTIRFEKNKKRVASYKYELKARKENSALRESFSSKDAVYLLMPDRFVNGDPKNDNIKGYHQTVDRSDLGQRHGGDLKGVIEKVPYIADLGCTALWITPFYDNNDTQFSYPHYSAGDYYKVDPRMGTNQDYKNLADSCHKYGIKLIIDVVPNHCGSAHWWCGDLPAENWFHKWPTFTGSNYRMTAWTDPHASEIDKKILQDGWFAGNMPDLDLTNPELFRYLSQAYIWWIEYADVDGIRVDTYPYNDINVAANWIKTFRDEYPNMNIVGECWVKSPLEISYYQSGNNNKDGFDSQLPSVMDFVLKDHLHAAFNERESWDFGMARFYAHYAQDFAYPDVDNIMNFLDNHDIDRFSTAVKRDAKKYKMGIAMLITTRGYPQIYAGTEIMIDGIPGNYEGHRFDFPGGWAEDERNAFTEEGRTDVENDIFNYTRALLNFRKNATALHNGKMKQFIPYDGIYFYARYTEDQTVLCIFNNEEADRKISLERYAEVIKDFTIAKDVVTGETFNLADGLTIKGKSALIVELN